MDKKGNCQKTKKFGVFLEFNVFASLFARANSENWNDNSWCPVLRLDEAKIPATEGSHGRLKCEKHNTVADKEIIDFWKHNWFRTRNDKLVCVRPVSISSEEILATKMYWKTNYLPNYSKIWSETNFS